MQKVLPRFRLAKRGDSSKWQATPKIIIAPCAIAVLFGSHFYLFILMALSVKQLMLALFQPFHP
jgi:hypothetical protein